VSWHEGGCTAPDAVLTGGLGYSRKKKKK
jgi:hypothetical protein